MIPRFLRRLSRDESNQNQGPTQEAIETCERELRTYERRYALLNRTSSEWSVPGRIVDIESHERGVTLVGEYKRVVLTWIGSDCLHVRLTQSDRPPLPNLPAVLSDVAVPPPFELVETQDFVEMTTASGICRVNRQLGTLSLSLPATAPAYVELNGLSWQAGKRGKLSVAFHPRAVYGGLGSRTDSLDVNLRRFPLWVQPQGSSGSAPLLLGTTPYGAFALLWLNPARGIVDVGASRPDEIVFEGEDDRIEYVVSITQTPLEALARCGLCFGRMPLPPLWALGYQHSVDDDAAADAVAKLAAEFRQREVPCDAIHLGFAYLDAARPFTVDAQRFPALRELIDDLHDLGFQVVAGQHPAIKADEAYPAFVSGARRHAFVRYPDGSFVRAAGHPGTSVFPDFIREDVRQWWSEQTAPLVRTGIDGIENRDSSPDIWRHGVTTTLPDAAQHGRDVMLSHASIHNLYANGMANASRAAFDEYGSALRHLLILPVSWAGSTQYGSPWITSKRCDWDGLCDMLRSVLNASLSAIPYFGVDLPSCEGGELQTRWLQACALMPGLRSPSGSDLPWAFGQPYELINRLTLELRYRLLPFLYSTIAQAREYGTPVIRPLGLSASTLFKMDDAYLIGEHLLAAPVTAPGVRERTLYLPPGIWYDYWTNEAHMGERSVTVPAPLERLPLFVRGGTSLPLHEVQHYVNERMPERQVVRIYPGSGETTLYEDHGEGLAYIHGEYRWVYYSCQWDQETRFSVSRRKAGTFIPAVLKSQIEIVGLPAEPSEVRLDRQGAPVWYYDDGILELVADDDFARIEVDFKAGSKTPTRRRGDL